MNTPGLNQVNKIKVAEVCGPNGETLVIQAAVSFIKTPDTAKPFRVTHREKLSIIKGYGEFGCYYLGRQKLSEHATVGEKTHYFTQYELTVAIPQEVCAENVHIFTKSFYPSPGKLREIEEGHNVGEVSLFTKRFPIEHMGKTAQSQVGINENRNNLYVAIINDNTFAIFVVAVVMDDDGVWLVTDQPYWGEVFVNEKSEIVCPFLQDKFGGKTRDPLFQLIAKWFANKKASLQPVPTGYQWKEPMNLDCLKRRGNQHDKSGEVFIHMSSVARRLSFGLCKGDDGTAQFVYISWNDLPAVKENTPRRVLVGMVVHGSFDTDGNGRVWLRNVRLLPGDEMAKVSLAVRDPERIELLGETSQLIETVQKARIRTHGILNIGSRFASVFSQLVLQPAA